MLKRYAGNINFHLRFFAVMLNKKQRRERCLVRKQEECYGMKHFIRSYRSMPAKKEAE